MTQHTDTLRDLARLIQHFQAAEARLARARELLDQITVLLCQGTYGYKQARPLLAELRRVLGGEQEPRRTYVVVGDCEAHEAEEVTDASHRSLS